MFNKRNTLIIELDNFCFRTINHAVIYSNILKKLAEIKDGSESKYLLAEQIIREKLIPLGFEVGTHITNKVKP